MNIFALSIDPIISAQLMCDKHVRSKLIVESAQMLANCYKLETLKYAPYTQKGTPRKYSYYNHPCSKWARETYGNHRWLLSHAHALVNERNYRWPNSTKHFSEGFLTWCSQYFPDNLDKESNHLTDFYQAFGKENEHLKEACPVTGYRRYYNEFKRYTMEMTWAKRGTPDFFKLFTETHD